VSWCCAHFPAELFGNSEIGQGSNSHCELDF
jgi:hypothetical protein